MESTNSTYVFFFLQTQQLTTRIITITATAPITVTMIATVTPVYSTMTVVLTIRERDEGIEGIYTLLYLVVYGPE